MTSLIKPKGVTWADWWASRTNKLTSIVMAIYTAMQAGDVSLTDLGVPEGWANWFASAVAIGLALGYFKLRADTHSPLIGRRHGK